MLWKLFYDYKRNYYQNEIYVEVERGDRKIFSGFFGDSVVFLD